MVKADDLSAAAPRARSMRRRSQCGPGAPASEAGAGGACQGAGPAGRVAGPPAARLAVVLYGYGRAHAEAIGRRLAAVLRAPVRVISASGREHKTVRQVLDGGGEDRFEPREERFALLLDFEPAALRAAIEGFPLDEGVPRPVFCVLTEANLGWTVERLMAHLREERREFEARFGRDGLGRGTLFRRGAAA